MTGGRAGGRADGRQGWRTVTDLHRKKWWSVLLLILPVVCTATGQSVPLRCNTVRVSIKLTVSQLKLWAVSDNGALKAFNMYEANDICTHCYYTAWGGKTNISPFSDLLFSEFFGLGFRV